MDSSNIMPSSQESKQEEPQELVVAVPAKPWKCNARQFFLTYPQCDMLPDDALQQYECVLSIKDYIVAREPHKDGNMHLHVYIMLDKRKMCKASHFDLKDGDVTYHGNYQSCRNGHKVQKYCKKGGVYITNMDFSVLRQAVNLAESGDVRGAFDAVAEARPDMILNGASRVLQSLELLKDRAEAPEEQQDLNEWVAVPAEIAKWNRKRQVLWLYGPSGVGKTVYAKTLFGNPLLVSHKDQLKGLNERHDGIILDDFGMTHWPREAAIHITDLENRRGIDVKHGHVVIPKGMPRVFCSNVWVWPIDETGAIKRRVFAVRCPERMFAQDDDAVMTRPDDHWDEIKGAGAFAGAMHSAFHVE